MKELKKRLQEEERHLLCGNESARPQKVDRVALGRPVFGGLMKGRGGDEKQSVLLYPDAEPSRRRFRRAVEQEEGEGRGRGGDKIDCAGLTQLLESRKKVFKSRKNSQKIQIIMYFIKREKSNN